MILMVLVAGGLRSVTMQLAMGHNVFNNYENVECDDADISGGNN